GRTRFLLDRQGVHVGTQPDHLAAGLAAADDADNTGAAEAGHDVVAAEALEFFRNDACRAMHVILKLGMGVQVTPPGGDLIVQVGDAVNDRHGFHPCWNPGGWRSLAECPPGRDWSLFCGKRSRRLETVGSFGYLNAGASP